MSKTKCRRLQRNAWDYFSMWGTWRDFTSSLCTADRTSLAACYTKTGVNTDVSKHKLKAGVTVEYTPRILSYRCFPAPPMSKVLRQLCQQWARKQTTQRPSFTGLRWVNIFPVVKDELASQLCTRFNDGVWMEELHLVTFPGSTWQLNHECKGDIVHRHALKY